MFLTEDRRHGSTKLVFTWDDPRKGGHKGNVIEDVRLDYDMIAVHEWPDGHERPEVCVGRAGDDPKRYKVFKYRRELQPAGYEPVPGTPLVFSSWSDYIRSRLDPPDPEQTEDEQWYDYLDKLDEDARRRRRRSDPGPPAGSNRDDVAAWLARKHLIADSGIREVRYLPHGAPADEIRLLELNDRLAGAESGAEAIDFNLDIEGAKYRLLVADITSDQLEEIQQDPSRLPPGWSLDGNKIWRRGA